jgi:nucleoside-diphosphate-sugar epimerase
MTRTVLITGGSGFIGASILNAFLNAGYHVRASARSAQSAETIRQNHEKHASALTFVIVPDITLEGAFDEAVRDVDGVIHVASPFIMTVTNFQKDLFEPAVKGTTTLLKSIKDFNPNIKRVVITSSMAAVRDPTKGPGYTYTEADWNPGHVEDATNAPVAYFISKALAEKAAWHFIDQEKPAFSITTILPGLVYGPNENAVTSMKNIGTSSANLYALINGSTKELPPTFVTSLVDVRDVAKAHLLAFESEKASGQRYLLSATSFTYAQVVRIIHEEFPQLGDRVPRLLNDRDGRKREEEELAMYKIDSGKSVRELGIEYRGLREIVVDSVRRLLEMERTLA